MDNKVTLTWDPPAQYANLVTGYEILRRLPSNGENSFSVLVSNTRSKDTTYVDETANEAGERYMYRVKALRGSLKSDRSNTATIDLPQDYDPDQSGSGEAEPTPISTPSPTPTPTPDVTISTAQLTVGEGETATYTVVLDAQPTANVTISITAGAGVTTDVSELTFTTDNWSAAQTVTVTGAPDDATAAITHAVKAGSAAEYASVTVENVAVTVEDSTVAVEEDDEAGPVSPLMWSGTLTVGAFNGGAGNGWNTVGNYPGSSLDSVSFTHSGDDYEFVLIAALSGDLYLAFKADKDGDAEGRELLAFQFGAGADARRLDLAAAMTNEDVAAPLYGGNITTVIWSGANVALTAGDTIQVQLERINRVATGAPAISGTPQADETLTADTSGIADEDGLDDSVFTYQWTTNDRTSDTNIPNAANSTYTPTADDVGKTIKVLVEFTDAAGFEESLTSAPTAAVTVAALSPLTPDLFSVFVLADRSAIVLNWKRPTEDYASVTGHQILRAVGGGEMTVLVENDGSRGTAYLDSDVEAGQTYAYRVIALRSGVKSPPSNRVEIEFPYAPAEFAPSGLAVAITNTGVALSWQAPARKADAVTGYQVLRAQGEQEPIILVSDTASQATVYTDTSATVAGETYFYMVMPVRGEEIGPASNLAVVKRPPEVTPLPPTDLVAEAVPGGVTLSWQEPADASPTGYSVMRGESEAELTVLVKDTGNTDTTYTDAVANVPGSTYTYEVAALYDKRESPPSNLAAVNRVSFLLGMAQLSSSECAPRSVLLERDSLEEAAFNTPAAAGNEAPTAIWSDGQFMWVADSSDDKLYAYRMSNMARAPSRDFNTLVAAGNDRPTGIWSNGETMWVADSRDNKLYAYRMSDKARDSDKDFDTLQVQAAGNDDPQDIWSNCETMWVADQRDSKVYAYQMSDKARQPGQDFNTLDAAGNSDPTALWSGTRTMWVAYYDRGKLFAYSMDDKARDNAKEAEIELKPGNRDVSGMWSNGATLWVADLEDAKIYAYDLPGRILLEFDVGGSDGASYPWGIWSDGETMWVSDPKASGDTRDAKIYAYSLADMSRVEDEDFDTLAAAGNDAPRGIWSNGAIMWVADSADDKIYAYNLETKARLPGQDFNMLDAAENNAPLGLWSDGDVMYVTDEQDDKRYAYRMSDKGQIPNQDIRWAVNDSPPQDAQSGLWSNDVTMWVGAASGNGKLLGYRLHDRRYSRAKDIKLGPDNLNPAGLWSNGHTIWVADPVENRIFAYKLVDPPPGVSRVTVEETTTTGATAKVYIKDADGSTVIVHLRYRQTSGGAWTRANTNGKNTILGPANFTLSGLTPDAEYEVEASLNRNFPAEATVATTLVTVDVPRLAGAEVTSVTLDEVVISATVTNADGSTVRLRHRKTGSTRWDTQSKSVNDGGLSSVRFALRRLNTGAEYEVQASLDSAFPTDATNAFTFSTPPVAWEAILTVGHDALNVYHGHYPDFVAGGSLSPNTFTLGGVSYTVSILADTPSADAQFLLLELNKRFRADSAFVLYLDDVAVYSGQWTGHSPTPLAGKLRYLWDIDELDLDLGWEDKTTVRVRLLPLANVCDRTPGVLEAILDATITTGDTCDAVSLLELAPITELDFTAGMCPR